MLWAVCGLWGLVCGIIFSPISVEYIRKYVLMCPTGYWRAECDVFLARHLFAPASLFLS